MTKKEMKIIKDHLFEYNIELARLSSESNVDPEYACQVRSSWRALYDLWMDLLSCENQEDSEQ